MNTTTKFIVAIAALMTALTSCKIAKNSADIRAEMVIFPDVQPLPSDEEIVFACHSYGKSGLYKINVATAAVTEYVRPQRGLLFKPSLSKDKQSIVCVWSGEEDGRYADYIVSVPVVGGRLEKLFKVPLPIMDFAISPANGRIYLFLAGDFGHSSPLVQSRFRLIELYSARLDGQDMQKEAALNAYSTGGKLMFDSSGTNLYFQLVSLSKSRHTGPYKYSVASKELTYLLPDNYAELEPDVQINDAAKGFLTDWLTPIPGKDSSTYFLQRQYATYQVNRTTESGKILYPLPGAGRTNFRSVIKGTSRFNDSNNLILCEQIGSNTSFMLLLERENNRRLTFDMLRFESTFY